MTDLRQALIRSVAEEAGAVRAVPFTAVTFEAFRVTENNRTYPLEFAEGRTLAGMVESAKVRCIHKEHLLIRETSDQGVKLHLYAIKKKATPRYEYRDYQTRRINDLYAAPICTMDGGVLSA